MFRPYRLLPEMAKIINRMLLSLSQVALQVIGGYFWQRFGNNMNRFDADACITEVVVTI